MRISVITPSIRPLGLDITRASLLTQTFKDFEWLVDINWTGKSDINASLNRLLKRAQGELVVILQDYIEIPQDGLQRFWDLHALYPRAFWTAPVSSGNDRIWDWRAERTKDDPCNFQEWEIDWAAAPRQALLELGGFDEELDRGWGFDNCIVGYLAEAEGYMIKCDNQNKAYGYVHDLSPTKKFRDPELYNQRLQDIRMGLRYNFVQ